MVFVEESKDTVWLRYHDETIPLSEFKTEEERKKERYLELESKYCKNRYLETREELNEFLTALEVFNDHKDFDEIEVLTYLKKMLRPPKTSRFCWFIKRTKNIIFRMITMNIIIASL